jgi:hypothetical protein
MRNMEPAMRLIAAVFDVPAADVLAAARTMEDLDDFPAVVKVLSRTEMPGTLSYRVRPLQNAKGANPHLVHGMAFTFILDKADLMDIRFLNEQTVLAGPGFVLSTLGVSHCKVTEDVETLPKASFHQKLFLHTALTAFPVGNDTQLKQLRDSLLEALQFRTYMDYDFAPGLVGAMEAALYLLDRYHGKTDLSYAGRWRHDVGQLTGAPKGKTLDGILKGTPAFFAPVYRTNSRLKRIVGMVFRIQVTETLSFDITVSDERVDVDLRFATFSTAEDAVFLPELAADVASGLTAEERALVYAKACKLVDAIAVVTKRNAKCEAVRRALKLFLTLSDGMEII